MVGVPGSEGFSGMLIQKQGAEENKPELKKKNIRSNITGEREF